MHDTAEQLCELLPWPDLTRKLLHDIETGRKTAIANEAVENELQAAYRERSAANAHVSEWVSKQCQIGDETTTEGKEARREFTEEMERRNAVAIECAKRADALFEKRNSAFAFSGAFCQDIRLLLDILPATPEFEPISTRINQLIPFADSAWSDPEAGSTLQKLKLRLKELLDADMLIGTGRQKGRHRRALGSVRGKPGRPRRRMTKEQKCAKARSSWLDQMRIRKEWTSDLDIAQNKGPAYNTVKAYRTGKVTTRTPYVRAKLAKAFGCPYEEVPA